MLSPGGCRAEFLALVLVSLMVLHKADGVDMEDAMREVANRAQMAGDEQLSAQVCLLVATLGISLLSKWRLLLRNTTATRKGSLKSSPIVHGFLFSPPFLSLYVCSCRTLSQPSPFFVRPLYLLSFPLFFFPCPFSFRCQCRAFRLLFAPLQTRLAPRPEAST